MCDALRSALVTGGTGFIGSALVSRLLDEQVEVTCLIRSKRNAKPLHPTRGLRVIEVSSFDTSSLKAKLVGISTEVIFNLASYGVRQEDRDAGELINGNVALLTNLLEATAQWPIRRFVHAGSCSEYGFPLAAGALITEDQPLRPTSLYGAAKAATVLFGNAFASHLGVPFLTLRLFGVYGKHEAPQRLIPYLLDRLERGEPVELTAGEQVRDLSFEDDVADAFIKAARTESLKVYEAYNVCSARPMRIRELAERVADIANRPRDLLRWGVLPYRSDEPLWLVGDNGRFSAATAWRPRVNFEEGILRVVSRRTRTWKEA